MTRISHLGLIILLSVVSTIWIGCGDDMPNTNTVNDQFDRSSMLEHWVDGFIIPGYSDYLEAIDSMDAKTKRFVSNPNTSKLNDLRNNYRFAYNVWQEVSMFEIGKAEELFLRNQTNSYPTDVSLISDNLISGSYNLELPSNIGVQGFPAVEYMIYSLADTDDEIIDKYINNANVKEYLEDLTNRMSTLTREVYTDWTTGYREVFIADDGSSASSSVNRMINDYLFYYERSLRAGKIGIPAGKFSGLPLASKVEAVYTPSPTINKSLYITSLTIFKDFFDGKSKYIGNGPSLSAYLDYIQNLTNGADIRGAIDTAIDNAFVVSLELDNDLNKQVLDDNSKMLATFDALQMITILLKVDMLSALNVSVDYVDADGD